MSLSAPPSRRKEAYFCCIPMRESYFAAATYLSASRGAACLDTNNEACLQLREDDTGLFSLASSSHPKIKLHFHPGLTQRLWLTSEEFIAPVLGALHKDTKTQRHLSQHVDCVFNETIRRVMLHQRWVNYRERENKRFPCWRSGLGKCSVSSSCKHT